MRTKTLEPIHPGEILREELMEPLGLSAHGLAMELRVPATRIGDILRGRARSRPTRRSAWRGTSVPAPISGSVCSPSTACGLPDWSSPKRSRGTFSPDDRPDAAFPGPGVCVPPAGACAGAMRPLRGRNSSTLGRLTDQRREARALMQI